MKNIEEKFKEKGDKLKEKSDEKIETIEETKYWKILWNYNGEKKIRMSKKYKKMAKNQNMFVKSAKN